MRLNNEQVKQFEESGYLVIPNFVNSNQCELLSNEANKIIQSVSHEEIGTSVCRGEVATFSNFHSPSKETCGKLMSSVDKVRIFAVDKSSTNEAAEVGEKQIITKIGYALHALNSVFHDFTFNNNVQELIESIDYKEPIVCQSTYIFRQPTKEHEHVNGHQDASFMYVEPLKVVTVLVNTEDFNQDGCCLYFIPGSNKASLDTRLIRNSNQEEFNNGRYFIFTNPIPTYDKEKFIPVPLKAGSVVLIDGLVVHKTENKTAKAHQAYAFTIYDSKNATYSNENWMEYNSNTFLPLNAK